MHLVKDIKKAHKQMVFKKIINLHAILISLPMRAISGSKYNKSLYKQTTQNTEKQYITKISL